jgi:hypothetical protein
MGFYDDPPRPGEIDDDDDVRTLLQNVSTRDVKDVSFEMEQFRVDFDVDTEWYRLEISIGRRANLWLHHRTDSGWEKLWEN